MEVHALSKHSRISPKKLIEIVSEVKGLSLDETIVRLKFSQQKGAKLLLKVVNSAIANAKNNLKFNQDNLKIKLINVTSGPAFKRWQAVAKGAAHGYKKRTSHIRVVLEEIKQEKPKELKEVAIAKENIKRKDHGTKS